MAERGWAPKKRRSVSAQVSGHGRFRLSPDYSNPASGSTLILVVTVRTSLRLILGLVVLLSAVAACGDNDSADDSGTTSTTTTEVPAVDPAEIAVSYPAVDGSTSAWSLQNHIACFILEVECDWVLTFSENTPRLIGPLDEGEIEESIWDIEHNGTHGSFVNLIEESTDLILVAREPYEDELDLAAANGVGLDVRPVARDAFVFIAHTDAPVDDLSIDNVRAIYSGEIISWDQVRPDGPDEIIRTYVRNTSSGSQQLMEELVMGDTPMVETSQELVLISMLQPINRLSNDPLGIGYSVYFYAAHIFPAPGVRMLAIDGVAPSAETIADGSYPYVTDVYVVVRNGEPEDSSALLLRDWLLTDDGQEVVASSGYIPLP